MAGQGQLLRSAWALEVGILNADDLCITQLTPQGISSRSSVVWNQWWFNPPAASTPTSGLGRKLHSAWMLDVDNYWSPARLFYTKLSPSNVLSAGPPVMVDWWFGAAFLGQAFKALPGTVGVLHTQPLTGISISTSTGILTPFGISGLGVIAEVPVPGPGVGPFANAQFDPQVPGYAFGIFIPLTGQSITATAGNLTPLTSLALTGLPITSAPGSVGTISGISVALVGQSFAATPGNLAGLSVSIPLTGAGATFTQATIVGTSGFRVMATAIGFYGGVFFGPGDVFDILQSGDFADSTIDYSQGDTGGPMFGWMKRVPASTPLTYPLTNPIYDYQPPGRRNTF